MTVHPDRLFPADPATRDVARRLYAEVATAPIISPHGHVDARVLLDDEPFPDPAALFITPDHYVTRLLHSLGVPLDQLGLGPGADTARRDGRAIWRLLCTHWDAFLGTPVRFWFESELAEVFGLAEEPSEASADRLYDELSARLAEPAFRPRALFERFNIDVLATTDDPADDLAAHLALREDQNFAGRVLPTFRADRYMTPGTAAWAPALDALAEASGIDTGSYAGLLDALRSRRAFFRAAGGTATDTGVLSADATPLADVEAERIHLGALAGEISEADAAAYRANLLYRFAEMSVDDGLVMQLHAGVHRGTHRPTLERFGPDTGHDLPAVGAYTLPLAPILNDFGTAPGFHLVLFTVDETLFGREIAPLAGFYASVYAGAPWWFLDTPLAIGRYRAAVTDTIGFRKTSGFIDDTRAFCSIPARHDMSRRTDASFLASLVVTHQVSEDDALGIARRLVGDQPREVFKL
ncbi:glucuronate isomerase [Gryllotalpicola reticulitermitis]|uniref:Uronate isomerase n=1 Tax=Gryllotalpicola reticulitermitis TaxID=1184153 RepID=A0ABV8Q0N9_9MICO